jgi:hypothetical protein
MAVSQTQVERMEIAARCGWIALDQGSAPWSGETPF